MQKHSNLQVWNYLPYTKDRYDCRYVIFRVDDEEILGLVIKTGKEIKDWDSTGTRTIKWQATVTDERRKKVLNKILVSNKEPIFLKLGVETENLEPLKSRKIKIENLQKEEPLLLKSKPYPNLLFTKTELKELLEPLLKVRIEYQSEKLLGQNFQRVVAEKLGYRFEKGFSVDSGQIPDIVHQLIETKVQISPTIDLGNHLPISNETLNFDWNKNNVSPRDIRYVIALAERTKDNKAEIKGIIITCGEEFEKFFSICEGTNFKVQMTIPNFNDI